MFGERKKIGVIEAPPGAGKTYSLISTILSVRNCRYKIVFTPSKKLADEYGTIMTSFGISHKIIHRDNLKSDDTSVRGDFYLALRELRPENAFVIVMPVQCRQYFYDAVSKGIIKDASDYDIYQDEIISPDEFVPVHLCQHTNIINDYFVVVDYNPELYQVLINPSMMGQVQKKIKASRKYTDKLFLLLKPILLALVNNELVLCRKDNWEKINNHKLVDEKKKWEDESATKGDLVEHHENSLNCLILERSEKMLIPGSYTVLGASIIGSPWHDYHKRNGIKFEKKTLSSLRYNTLDHLLTRTRLYYCFDKNASKYSFNKDDAFTNAMVKGEALINADEKTLLFLNNDKKDDFRDGNKITPSVLSHGLNCYDDVKQVIAMYACNRTPVHLGLLKAQGFSDVIIKNEQCEMVFQNILRSALRNPNHNDVVTVVVPDRESARYIMAKIPGLIAENFKGQRWHGHVTEKIVARDDQYSYRKNKELHEKIKSVLDEEERLEKEQSDYERARAGTECSATVQNLDSSRKNRANLQKVAAKDTQAIDTIERVQNAATFFNDDDNDTNLTIFDEDNRRSRIIDEDNDNSEVPNFTEETAQPLIDWLLSKEVFKDRNGSDRNDILSVLSASVNRRRIIDLFTRKVPAYGLFFPDEQSGKEAKTQNKGLYQSVLHEDLLKTFNDYMPRITKKDQQYLISPFVSMYELNDHGDFTSRLGQSCLFAQSLWFDIDSGYMLPTVFAQLIKDNKLSGIIYSTFSNTSDYDTHNGAIKYRVVLFLNRFVSPNEYERLWHYVSNILLRKGYYTPKKDEVIDFYNRKHNLTGDNKIMKETKEAQLFFMQEKDVILTGLDLSKVKEGSVFYGPCKDISKDSNQVFYMKGINYAKRDLLGLGKYANKILDVDAILKHCPTPNDQLPNQIILHEIPSTSAITNNVLPDDFFNNDYHEIKITMIKTKLETCTAGDRSNKIVEIAGTVGRGRRQGWITDEDLYEINQLVRQTGCDEAAWKSYLKYSGQSR